MITNNTTKAFRPLSRFLLGLAIFLATAIPGYAGGISTDAGLTPAQDRWIFRTQWRYMHRSMAQVSDRDMTMHMIPVVAAYGLRPNLTLMARQMIVSKEMNNGKMRMTSSGLGDFLLMAKYKAYRFNSKNYVLGLSPTIGLEMPFGVDGVSAHRWNLHTGLYASGRYGSWAADFNAVYVFTGIARDAGVIDDPGDEFTTQIAFARQFGFGARSIYALAPVLELSYLRVFADRDNNVDIANTGESVMWLSPGAKFTWGSLILECLIQIPVYHDYTGMQMDRDPTYLTGIRLMM